MPRPSIDPEVARHLAQAGDRITIRVAPGAARTALTLDLGGPEPILRAAVTAPPEAGKANAAVLAMLAKALGVPKSALVVVRGRKDRTKLVQIRRP